MLMLMLVLVLSAGSSLGCSRCFVVGWVKNQRGEGWNDTYTIADANEVVNINDLVLVVDQVDVGNVGHGSGRRPSGGQLLLLVYLLGAGHCLLCRWSGAVFFSGYLGTTVVVVVVAAAAAWVVSMS